VKLLLEKIKGNSYAGYSQLLDYHSNISQSEAKPGTTTDFSKYGFNNKINIFRYINLTSYMIPGKIPLIPEGGSFFYKSYVLHNSTILGAAAILNSCFY